MDEQSRGSSGCYRKGQFRSNTNKRINNINKGDQKPHIQIKYGGTGCENLQNKKAKNSYFSFKRLQEFSEMDCNNLVTKLFEKKNEFQEFLTNLKKDKPDIIVLTVQILGNICQADFNEILASVLSYVCSPHLIDTIELYVSKLMLETPIDKIKNKFYHNNKDKFWFSLIEFFKKVVALLPNKARDELQPILQKIVMIFKSIETVQGYKVDEKIVNTTINLLKDLTDEINRMKAKVEVLKQKKEELNEITEPPPEDFRLLSVNPTMEDLNNFSPYIRRCRIKDAYDSVDHYLDVQFRLLREDFISPLRSGIKEYSDASLKHRNNDLRIYKKVKLLTPEVTKDAAGILVNFGMIKNVNWNRSKRFMHGALLLLSRDNFATVVFATVSSRDEKELGKGFILIELCEGNAITRDMYDSDFVMLESKIYFQPYLVVLRAMQFLNENNFPMIKYLVQAETSSTLPLYLERGGSFKYKGFNFTLHTYEMWPKAEELGLDESQYNAFKCALTEEFAVIQGPPGTGKTFIALKIAGTLIENKHLWRNYGPIVVVCLTNHALDQFLEGILMYTQSIVRIGSRSKNETLKPYTLKERRNTFRERRSNNSLSLMYEKKRILESIIRSMITTRYHIRQLTTPNVIVPLSCLNTYIHDKKLSDMELSDKKLINWLTYGNVNLDAKIEVPILNKTEHSLDESLLNLIGECHDEDEHEHLDDELELEYSSNVSSDNVIYPLIIINSMINTIHDKLTEYRKVLAEIKDEALLKEFKQHRTYLYKLTARKLSMQRELAHHPILSNQLQQPSKDSHWNSYWGWVKTSYEKAIDQLINLENTYRQTRSQMDEFKQLVDLDLLKAHDVIGLTTTGAARLHSSLSALHAPIVLVEEAAEILEAHVVCSMAKDCQHVILIGDHKQLRPKASVYELGTKYNLNVSLFERMVNIKGDCTQLAHQHRMRSEIAKLITPSIYAKLYNHSSVLDYPNVKGLEKNLFFLHHTNHESSNNNEESWTNKHEADFLIALAKHLTLQGYAASEITILATYSGQLFLLMKEIGRHVSLQNVRVTTVDNYQGEENKIILLSLVRNNGEGNIGFLKEENRVCVALSRAREGLYILGNMNDLSKSKLWSTINEVLKEEKSIGDFLELRCQIHQDQCIKVAEAKDFDQCPEGGCLKTCSANLACGHVCTSVCHVLDRDHQEYRCRQPCVKTCPYDHPCTLSCWQGCQPCRVVVQRKLKCEHIVNMLCSIDADTFPCYIEVDVVLPDCNHDTKKQCHTSIETCKCPHPCTNRLPCGHTCRLTCHVKMDPDHIEYKCFKDCENLNVGCQGDHKCKKRCHETCDPCSVLVPKSRSCGHYYKQFQCSKNVEEEQCIRPCKKTMDCGHKCMQKCFEPCENCQVKVIKESICGHKFKVKCCEEATPSKCSKKCQKKLPCGHLCSARCKEPCTPMCQVVVKQNSPGLCGHLLSVPCYLSKTDPKSPLLLKYCSEPCKVPLECSHACAGKCGDCKQGRIHIPCAEPCSNILVCGHQCETRCRMKCQTCQKTCEMQCSHSRCNKKCGIPCVPCKEKCTWGCEHQKCSKLCGELCDIAPCEKPCEKVLKCNHPCVGFCGDPCPPLCRICNEEELTTIVFGDEDDPNARFVFLEDCKHCIESNALLRWLKQSNESIQVRTCPMCKTPIKKCMRVMNHIKEHLEDVQRVKQKLFFGNKIKLQDTQREYLEVVKNMQKNPVVIEFPIFQTLLLNLQSEGNIIKNNRHQLLNSEQIEAFRIILEILNKMFDTLQSVKSRDLKSCKFIKDQVTLLLSGFPTQLMVSKQQIDDLELELRRLKYMTEVYNHECKDTSGIIINSKNMVIAINKLLSIEKFDKTREADVRKLITSSEFEKALLVYERKMIVQAIGLKQGHWFKCPNGHIYAIGECGGAMQQSKCNECGAEIGGTSHRLLNSNRLATEMDGATQSAWPGVMAQYGFR